jgi:predicted AlkP superfamily phosphohydrolase/phosphomutase
MTRTSVFKQHEETSSFSDVDWSKTKAYAIGFNSIYVNLKGREKDGIVEDRSEVVEDIVAKLQNFVDQTTKKKVVHRAYRREEIYSGEFVENAPDIIIGFNPEYRMGWQTAIGGIDATATYPNPRLRLADHLSDPAFVPGVLFSNARLREGPFELVDICPTLLDALGLSVPETMDGKSLLK